MLQKLEPNGTIGIIAPAFVPNATRLERGIDYLKKRGFKIKRGHSLSERYGYFAGKDRVRVEDLHDMYTDPEVQAILCARGGWGTLRLLDQIDYLLIQNHPKLLVGYSDITTLQLAIWQQASVPTLSGPMVAVEMGNQILPFTERHFWDQVIDPSKTFSFNFADTDTEIWQQGTAHGLLLGGCLSMVSHQLGTPYSPDYRGAILFLEEVGEEPYKVDRYLAHLRQAGLFDQIEGLILGNYIDCSDDNPDRHSFSVQEVLKEYFGNRPYPVLYNFPYGHGDFKLSMPIGVTAKIDTFAGQIEWQSLFYENSNKLTHNT